MLAELVSESEETACNWSKIASNYAVPKSLYRHQLDTITLILKGKHVFCGSPTGSGKTLAQLSTVLFTGGKTSIHI